MHTTTIPDRPPFVLRMLIKAQNPFMKWLLRSRMHHSVSDKYMLIALTGRKSGRVYTIPVQYAQDGEQLCVVTSESYKWWKNLRGGAPVQALLRGMTYNGYAEITTDPQIISRRLERIYPGMSVEKRARFALGRVVITISLQKEKEDAKSRWRNG